MVNISEEPRFRPEDEQPVQPQPTAQSNNITKKVMNKNMSFVDHALSCIPDITKEEFKQLFSALMNIFHHQSEYKCIAVSPPSVDLVCRISLHNELPELDQDNNYVSQGYAVFDDYMNIPGVKPGFPGMVATSKGAVFGEPTHPRNEPVLGEVHKARRPKASLKNKGG